MTIHSPSLSTDSVFCACGEKKGKNIVTIKTTISQIKVHPANTHTLEHLFFSSSTPKPISTLGVRQTDKAGIYYANTLLHLLLSTFQATAEAFPTSSHGSKETAPHHYLILVTAHMQNFLLYP